MWANVNVNFLLQFDEDQDGVLFPEDLLEALESVNSNLLSDSHITYIYRVSQQRTLLVIIYRYCFDRPVAEEIRKEFSNNV